MRGLLVLGLCLATGCASNKTTITTDASSTATTTISPAPNRSRNADIITAQEVAEQQGVTNAFDLIRRIRPNFLRVVERTSIRSNSSAPLVRVNGQLLGDVTELRTIEIGLIQEIRYYSIVEAENQFSGDRGRPVIAVTTKTLVK